MVKSRFQSELPLEGQPRKYAHTLPALARIYREEGFTAIYKGFLPKAIRMGLGGAVAMSTFEFVQYLFHMNL